MLPIILALFAHAEIYTKEEMDSLSEKLATVPHPYDYSEAHKLITKLLKDIRTKDL